MKVKLLVSRAGVDFSQAVGEVIDVDEAEGVRMIAAEQAVALREDPKKETAAKKPAVEKAAK